jgi:hypothetical protein
LVDYVSAGKEAERTLRVLETQDVELREEPLLRAALIMLAR